MSPTSDDHGQDSIRPLVRVPPYTRGPSLKVTWSIHSSLQSRARATLISAWNDYYGRDYEWTIRKAWEAASIALLSLDPTGKSPLASRVYGSKCSIMLDQYRESLILDSYYALVSDEWLRLILWGNEHWPGKEQALSAIESAVKLLDAATACGPSEWTPRPISRQKEYDMIRVGTLLIMIVDGVEEIPIYRRIEEFTDYFDPSYYNIILSGDEALAYLQLPYSRLLDEIGEVEPIVDVSGIASVIASTSRRSNGSS